MGLGEGVEAGGLSYPKGGTQYGKSWVGTKMPD